MRTPTDAARSMKKYIALALGPEWEVRMVGEEGAFERPFARVGPVTGARYRMAGMLHREATQPFSIVCHPVEMPTPDQALVEAQRVQMLLMDAFTVGIHAPSRRVVGGEVIGGQAYSISRGHPLRVPLYDYTGIALDAPATEDDRLPNDFLRVVGDVTVDVVADPNDDLRVAVAAAATMSWVLSAAVLSEAMTAQSVTAESEES